MLVARARAETPSTLRQEASFREAGIVTKPVAAMVVMAADKDRERGKDFYGRVPGIGQGMEEGEIYEIKGQDAGILAGI